MGKDLWISRVSKIIGVLGLALFAASSADAANVFGVSSTNQLVRFDSGSPNNVTTVGPISGLQAGENILGIDFRPSNGQLYALGSTSRIYIINKSTAAAAAVNQTPFSPALSGTSFGFDFNPVPDAIRIVSNTGQNLRINPNTGVSATSAGDTGLNPGTPSVTAAAYVNNFAGATVTTLYGIDTALNTLVTVGGLNGTPSPNGGTVTMVGPLGVDPTDVTGFDFTSGTGTAYAALSTGGVSQLYTVNLTTGAATLVGIIGSGPGVSLNGMAVEIGSTAGYQVYGITTSNQLVRFNAARPNSLFATLSITGLQAGENILGIDFRPATGQLFALGSSNRLYTLDVLTGAATQVGAGLGFVLTGTDFGFDFNPQPDRIRVVSNTGQNIRINPNDGTLVTPPDTNLSPGTPQVTGAAYTNSFPGTTATTLYDIDSGSDSLLLQGGLNSNPSPNGGVLTAVGPLGVDTTNNVGFDIAPGINTALAALQVTGSTVSTLFRVDLSTGSAAVIGPIGGSVIRDIAIARTSGAGAGTARLDYDGDGRTDNSVFRLSNNNWLIQRSGSNSVATFVWGIAGSDILTPGDYDGDGRADVSVWRPSDATFYTIGSTDFIITVRQFGQPNDEPVARDYDGDGRTDYAVVRREGGVMNWYIQTTGNSGSFRVDQFGIESDVVTPGDYDGDGRYDLAVRRGTGSGQATFYLRTSTGQYNVFPFGVGADLVVPGDYDGDGKTDLSALRQGSTYTWFYVLSSNLGFNSIQLGNKPDYSIQGDYDGDGVTDVATFDPIDGVFRYYRSTNAALVQTVFGQNGDYPVANYDTH